MAFKGHKAWNKGLPPKMQPRFGKHNSEEAIRKTKETRIKNGGYIISEEQRKAISLAQKGNKSWLGRKHTAETKEKLRKQRLGMKATQETKLKMAKIHFKGGKTHIKRLGYIKILSLNHSFRDTHNYVFEHRLVMEKHLGRYLTKEEVVHHINENTSDNRLENLMLFPNKGSHKAYHLKLTRERVKLLKEIIKAEQGLKLQGGIENGKNKHRKETERIKRRADNKNCG